MATSYPVSFTSTTSLESFYRSHSRGTAASLPALLQPLPEMEEDRPRLRRDHRSLTPTRQIRPPLTRTSSGDEESFTFRSERSLVNPRKPNEMTDLLVAVAEQSTTDSTDNRLSDVREENEDEEQFRRHSKDDEQLFRSGRRRSI